MNNMAPQVLDLLAEFCDGPIPGADTDLFAAGLLDSLGLAQFLEAAEDRWGVELYPTQFPKESLSTPAALAQIIAALLEDRCGY